ncbi:hypothetical protein Nepgr_016366 [Nepenthes gracilis]|uniref:Uncharacterized protein n=1 Tax=Nepenthes gracilis TaxID=150966 RepID=A0AAD3SMJ8_NEPGR|nr:hypothetical protein Nepgr_016366 [Nepenthes gracilis]
MDALASGFTCGKFLEQWAWLMPSPLAAIRWQMGSGFGDIGCSSNLLIAGPYQLVQFGRKLLLSAEVTLRLVAFAGIQLTLTAPFGPGAVGLNAALAANLVLSLYWVVKFVFCCSISSHWLV